MRTPTSARPADYVKPRLSEARIERMWAVVARAQQPAAIRRLERWAVGGVLAAAACIALTLWLRPWNIASHGLGTRAVTRGDTFATEANQRQVTLLDGSVLSIGPSTRIEVVRLASDEVRLRLLRGVLTCDVTHLAGRQFVVEAGSADVTVKGTRFTIELQPEAVTSPELLVSVERGRVQLRLDGRTVAATLESGQQWTSRKPAVPVPSAEPAESVESEVSAASAAPATSTRGAGPPAPLGAGGLMERANAARLDGRLGDAAREYARLCEQFPGDVRAGLAAFELGRIRLTSLGDPRGALQAFRFALAHQRGGFFVEDAQAGAIEALNRLGI